VLRLEPAVISIFPVSGGAASRSDSISGMQADFRARLARMFHDAPAGSSVFSGYFRQHFRRGFLLILTTAVIWLLGLVIRIMGLGTPPIFAAILDGSTIMHANMGCIFPCVGKLAHSGNGRPSSRERSPAGAPTAHRDRFAHGTADHDGRAGVPHVDYMSIA
jgi:hypothetical protein